MSDDVPTARERAARDYHDAIGPGPAQRLQGALELLGERDLLIRLLRLMVQDWAGACPRCHGREIAFRNTSEYLRAECPGCGHVEEL